MRKLLYFFSGLCILGLIFSIVYFTSLFFNMSKEFSINADIFQPALLSNQRIGKPIKIEDLTDNYVLNKLIKKYINEYFYVIPNSSNITARVNGNTVLNTLSDGEVFKQWKKDIAPDIQSLVSNNALRRVSVIEPILKQGDYYTINYELTTYENANRIGIKPTFNTGTLYLKINFEPGVRSLKDIHPFNIEKYLNDGGDPAGAFKFRVMEIKS